MFGEGWIVGHDTEGIAVEVEATFGDFENEAGARTVGDHPVEFGDGELVAEEVVCEIEV